ncbi:MAG TPA: hypothetical protein VIG71_12460 [Enteractinococcus sp.]
MRNFLAVILAILAGMTAVFGLVSWKMSELIHQPEPIQEIFGSGRFADDFKAAVPTAVANLTTDTTGVAVVDDALRRAVSEASGRIVGHENFDTAWAETLEQTRAGWLQDISALRERMDAGEAIPENATEAQLDLELGPVTDLTLSMIEEAVAEATAHLPGVDPPVLRDEADSATTVATPLPPLSVLTAEQVVLAEELMTMWPAILALAAIIFLMAVIVAARGSRWIVWLVTGLVVALCGAAVKVGLMWLQHMVLQNGQDDPSLALVRPLLAAVEDWSNPQLIVLIVAAVGVALLGILGGFIASNRRRSYYSSR